jgi:DNA mismatch repair protein MutS2
LILLDEVGTGTDPEEGSALGVAMVDYFRERGAHVIVTTHYSGLKIYATTTPGVLNASVEFDERTLKPTYHLINGLAGSSSGIEIARRFGLPKGITDRAADRVKTASADATEYLRRLKDQFDQQQQPSCAGRRARCRRRQIRQAGTGIHQTRKRSRKGIQSRTAKGRRGFRQEGRPVHRQY